MIEYYTKTDFKQSIWSGGKTTELLLLPEGASYKDRSFSVRLSSATLDVPSSSFTHLEKIKRFITPITHPFLLEVNGASPFLLSPFEVFEFSGSDEVKSYGMSVDFNLMLDERRALGWMKTLKKNEKQEEITLATSAGNMFWFFSYFPSTVFMEGREHLMEAYSLLVVKNISKPITFSSNERLIYGALSFL